MADQFDKFIRRILSHEGGFSDNRKDPGNWTGGKVGLGELKGTKFGIAANTYPHLDIRGLTWDQAAAIYRRDYWDKARCGELPPAVGYQLLDGAVNSGVGRATRWLQAAAGTTPDGVIGPMTLAAVASAEPCDLVLRFLAGRLEFMSELPAWQTFSKGWARRIAANMRYGAEDTP